MFLLFSCGDQPQEEQKQDQQQDQPLQGPQPSPTPEVKSFTFLNFFSLFQKSLSHDFIYIHKRFYMYQHMIKLNEKRMINRLPKQFVYILNFHSFLPLEERGSTTLNVNKNEKKHKC